MKENWGWFFGSTEREKFPKWGGIEAGPIHSVTHSSNNSWKWKWSHSVVSDSATPWIVGLPGFSIHGIFQARVLEWAAIFFSRGSSRRRNRTLVSCIAGRCFAFWANCARTQHNMWVVSYVWLCDAMDCSPPGSSCPWDFPGKNTGVGCCFLLQGIFLTLGRNSSLLHLLRWHVDSLPLAIPGKPIVVLGTTSYCWEYRRSRHPPHRIYSW